MIFRYGPGTFLTGTYLVVTETRGSTGDAPGAVAVAAAAAAAAEGVVPTKDGDQTITITIMIMITINEEEEGKLHSEKRQNKMSDDAGVADAAIAAVAAKVF